MPKDYKNSPRPKDKPRGKKGGGLPGWGWLVIGIIVGVIVIKAAPHVWKKAEEKLHIGPVELVQVPRKPPAKPPAAATAAAAPHFDFYKMLPSFQVVIPSQDKETRSPDVPGPVSQPGSYILQVGSFQSFAEADKLKANLALLGVESDIQQVKVNNGTTWNRVRIGPIQNLAQLNTLRAQLAEHHIKPLVIKIN